MPPSDSSRGDERDVLLAWLDFHRTTLEAKCADLSAEQLRTRAVPPSNLSLLGLLRHMTEVELHWFRRVLLDERVRSPYTSREDPDGDFGNLDQAEPQDVLDRWHAACEDSRHVVAGIPDLGAMAKRDRPGTQVNLRWILVHLVEEYARHNGHADLLRESIDGATGHLPYP